MELRHFTIKEVEKKIEKEQPRLIFLAGKTCVGKSTFARSLKKFSYKHLELDLLIREKVVKKFKIADANEAYLVYKDKAPREWQQSFEKATHNLIEENLKFSKIVVDAAIADVKVLKRIFSENLNDFLCVYLYPFDQKFYYQAIFNRFVKDIKTKTQSFPIWDYITPEILDDYLKNGKDGRKIDGVIRRYRDESTALSAKRYEKFKRAYPKIILSGH